MAYPGSRKVKGYLKLPDGPNIQKQEQLVKWLRANPGWVNKHKDWVHRSGAMLGNRKVKDLASLAGYVQAKDGTLQQYEGGSSGARGKLVRVWFPPGSPNATQKATKALANNPNKTTVFVGGKKVDPKTGFVPKAKPKPKPQAGTGPAPDTGGGVDTSGGQPQGDPFAIPEVNFSGLDSLNANTAQLLNPKLAQGGAKLYDPSVADAQAGLQFDGQIQQLRDAALKNPLDTQQHVKDIGSWYQQVLGSLKTAGERDAAIGKAAVDETQANTQAVISAIGGSANEGAGLVGAAGAQTAGTLGALGVAQDQYNQDLAPILQAEAAAQKTREQAAGSSKLHDLQLQIAAALGQRGQAKAVNQLQIDQANNGILDARLGRQLEIGQANNAARQQNFQNQYGLETTKIGAQVSGAKEVSDITQTLIKQQGAAQKKGPKPWASTPAASKKYAYDNLTGELRGNLDAYKKDPKLLMNFTRNFVNKNGWSLQNPNVMAWVRNAYRDAGLN